MKIPGIPDVSKDELQEFAADVKAIRVALERLLAPEEAKS